MKRCNSVLSAGWGASTRLVLSRPEDTKKWTEKNVWHLDISGSPCLNRSHCQTKTGAFWIWPKSHEHKREWQSRESRQVSEAKIKRREIAPERMSDRVRRELLVRFNLNVSPEGWDLIHIGKIKVLSASWCLVNPVAPNKSIDVRIQVKYSSLAAVRYEANQGRSWKRSKLRQSQCREKLLETHLFADFAWKLTEMINKSSPDHSDNNVFVAALKGSLTQLSCSLFWKWEMTRIRSTVSPHRLNFVL